MENPHSTKLKHGDLCVWIDKDLFSFWENQVIKKPKKTLLSMPNKFCHLSSGRSSQVVVTLYLNVEQTDRAHLD